MDSEYSKSIQDIYLQKVEIIKKAYYLGIYK